MRTVNVRQLHEQTGAIVDLVAEGNVVVVIKRGRRVAELRPPSSVSDERTLPERAALLARFPRLQGDSGRYLEDDRS